MTYVKFLRDTDIFYGLPNEHLEHLAEVCREQRFDADAIIVEENTPSDELFIIIEGTVDIMVDPSMLGVPGKEDPGPTRITTLRPGQTFGELGLVDRGLRSATAHANVDDTKVLAITRRDMLDLCETDYQLGYYLMRNIATDLAFKIRNTDLLIRDQLLWHPRVEPQDL